MAHRNVSLLGASMIERYYTECDASDDTLQSINYPQFIG